MKKLIILSTIAIGGLFYNTASAQIRFHFGINLLPQRVYVRPAPVEYDNDDQVDYDASDDYYYLPDVGAYYNVSEQCYYYYDGDNWTSAAYLPGYQYYDWSDARRFEVRAPHPYLRDEVYRERFHGQEGNWEHNADHFRRDEHNYNAYGGYDHHFDNRGQGRNDHHFDNRGGDGQRFDNRGRGGYGQQDNINNRGGQQYDQNRGRGNDGGQQFVQNQNRAAQQIGQNRGGGNDNRQNNNQNARGYDGHH
jgi:hypothetical protein